MILIYVHTVTSAERAPALEAMLRRVVAAARRVKGCQTYAWYKDPEADYQYTVYGEFDTEENFRLYKQSQVVEMIVQELIPLTTAKPRYKHFRAEVFEQG